MAIKTLTQLYTAISTAILSGGRQTTASNTRSVMQDVADSSLNKKDGGLVIESEIGYTTQLAPTDNKAFTTKKYVDDSVAGSTIPDANTTIKGKSQLITDAELDSATPSDNSASIPSFINKVLDLRGVVNFWKRVMSVFYTKTYTDDNFVDIYSSSLFVYADNSGSGNAYVGTNSKFIAGSPSIFMLGFSDTAGYLPTGTATLNLNGAGALPLLAEDGTNLVSGQIIARTYPVVSDDVAFYVQGVRSSSGGGISDAPNNSNAYVRSGLAWVVGYTKSDVDTLLSDKQNALGFTPEDSANKSTSTGDSASSVKFPVWSAIVSYFTSAQIKSILGITTLSGNNTGDQDLSTLAPKSSPNLTGTPTAPTAPSGDNTSTIANTKFVQQEIATHNTLYDMYNYRNFT